MIRETQAMFNKVEDILFSPTAILERARPGAAPDPIETISDRLDDLLALGEITQQAHDMLSDDLSEIPLHQRGK